MIHKRPSRPNDALFPDVPIAYYERRCVNPPIGCGMPLAVLPGRGFERGLNVYFRTATSAKEYEMTSMCQDCQDKFFDAADREE